MNSNNNYDTYRIWAPDDALWTGWAKPVLFSREPRQHTTLLNEAAAEWAQTSDKSTALIVDLPGESSVLEGIALAKQGYRPVPLYNGVYGPNKNAMAIDVTSIVNALYQGAKELQSLSISADAAPAFLLDSDRLEGASRLAGKYDNRWCVFPQDMPSASFLLSHGIAQVYLRANGIQNDLIHILRRYQEKGIKIYHIDATLAPKELTVARPSYFKSALYRIKTMAGLTRNAAGGFGGMVPDPMQSGGHRYYGAG